MPSPSEETHTSPILKIDPHTNSDTVLAGVAMCASLRPERNDHRLGGCGQQIFNAVQKITEPLQGRSPENTALLGLWLECQLATVMALLCEHRTRTPQEIVAEASVELIPAADALQTPFCENDIHGWRALLLDEYINGLATPEPADDSENRAAFRAHALRVGTIALAWLRALDQ